MLNTLKNAWRIPDLRKKLIFTVIMMFVFRIGAFIPVPGVDASKLSKLVGANQLTNFLDIISGGSFKYATIFALSVTPYINASIILQLLTVAIPYLEKLNKEGQEGRKKIAEYTRYLTIVLGVITAIGYYMYLSNSNVVKEDSIWTAVMIIIALTAGTAFLMWIGEKITEKGIGNGMSLLIFTGIVSRAPQMIKTMYQYYSVGKFNIFQIAIILVVAVAVIGAIVFFDRAERKIPVQYPRRVVGRTNMGGQVSYMPIKVNIGNVLPLIFAMSVMQVPMVIANLVKVNSKTKTILDYLSWTSYGVIIYALLIIFFTFFYASIMFNTEEIADNMKKNGAFIPGVRQGKDTQEFLSTVLNRVTIIGAVFLMVVAVLPQLAEGALGIQLGIGATSILIMVGVALETVRQIEAQMHMKHYRGFLD